MKKLQSGMVLVTTMIMIGVLTMLVLSLMQTVLLYVKITHQLVVKHDTLSQLEKAANNIFSQKDKHTAPACQLTASDPNYLRDLLINHRGCSLSYHNRLYEYFIGDLGVYPCLQIVSDDKIYSSHHWLVSVISSSSRQVVLQVRVSEPSVLMKCNLFEARQISRGVISWRYLP